MFLHPQEPLEHALGDVAEHLLAFPGFLEPDVGLVRGERHDGVGIDLSVEAGHRRRPGHGEQLLQRERVGRHHAVEALAGVGLVGVEHRPRGGREVGGHVHVPPEAGPAVLVVVAGVVGVRRRQGVGIEVGELLDRRELRELEPAVLGRHDRVGAPDAAGPTLLRRALGHEEVGALAVGAGEVGQPLQRQAQRGDRVGRLFHLPFGLEARVGHRPGQQRRRGVADPPQRCARVILCRHDLVAEARDRIDGERPVLRGERAEPVGQGANGVHQLGAGVGEFGARFGDPPGDVDVPAQDRDRAGEAREATVGALGRRRRSARSPRSKSSAAASSWPNATAWRPSCIALRPAARSLRTPRVARAVMPSNTRKSPPTMTSTRTMRRSQRRRRGGGVEETSSLMGVTFVVAMMSVLGTRGVPPSGYEVWLPGASVLGPDDRDRTA